MGSDEALAKAEAGFADSWARNWDAVGLAWRYRSSRLHDVSAPFGNDMAKALATVNAPVLVLAVNSDRTHPIALNEAMAKGLVNGQGHLQGARQHPRPRRRVHGPAVAGVHLCEP